MGMVHKGRFSAFVSVSLAAHVVCGAALLRASRPNAAKASLDEGGRTGDTFDVPDEEQTADELQSGWLDPGSLLLAPGGSGKLSPDPSSPEPDTVDVATLQRVGEPAHRSRTSRSRGRPGSSDPAPPPPALYGAAGERGAADLATTFTRSFPQAASTDPVWASVPFGSAGEADIVLSLDSSGSLTSTRIEGSPSPALRAAIFRTLALIRARAFTASSARTRLHVRASVSRDEVHDGLHGEVFAIGGSFATGEGNAFFALAIGRRIDVTLRVR
jgi:hypothetical protein